VTQVANWPTARVSEVSESIRYGHTASADDTIEGPRFLRITDIQDGRVDWSAVPSCLVTPKELDKYRLRENDIVFARTGATTGKSFLIERCPEAVFASYLIRLRLKPVVQPKYVAYFFQSPKYWAQIERGKRGSGQPGVNAQVLGQVELPIAPADEQDAIVSEIEKHLSRIDAGAAALKRVQANLKHYRASVLKAACEGRLVPTEAELARRESRDYEPASILLQRILKERRGDWEATELAKFKAKGKSPTDDGWKGKYKAVETRVASKDSVPPEGWVVARLADIAEVRLGRQRSPERATGPHMCAYLRAANVTWAGIDTSDVKEMDFTPAERKIYRLQRGDILMSEASGSVSEVGKPAIWHDEIADCCFQNTLLRVRATANLGEFLFWQLMADARLGQFEDHAPGVGIHHLGAERLSGWLIRLPPQSEQTRIVAEIQRRLSLSAALEEATSRALKRSEGLRQSVLKDAFAGKLVPPSSLPAGGIDRTGEIVAKRDKRRSVTELSDV